MTTDTFPLPSTYAYGKVVGRIIYAIGDTAEDADDKPQARAAAGTVTFTPMATGAKVTTADYTAIVMNGAVKANLSSSGRILDAEGRQGIWLIQGIYRVDFSFTATSDGLRGSLPPFQIEVLPAHTDLAPLDLASAAPASVPEGAVVQTIVLPTGSGIMSRNAVSGEIEYLDPDDLGGATTLDGLTDVATSGVTSGQTIIWNGTAWVPGTPPTTATWTTLSGKPAVVAAGADAAAARTAIGAAPTDAATTAAAGLVTLAASGDTTSTSKAMTPALVKALIDGIDNSATTNALAARLRTDTASQGLTTTQQSNARINLDVADAPMVLTYSGTGYRRRGGSVDLTARPTSNPIILSGGPLSARPS